MAKKIHHFDYSFISDPKVFAVNRIPAHSDHVFYGVDVLGEKCDARQYLNGKWKIEVSHTLASANRNFFEKGYDVSGWKDIMVPSNIEMTGLIPPHYVNTMYPWDGLEYLRPPQVPQEWNPTASYVKTFSLTSNLKNKPLFISFQGVQSAFALWLNGKFVGYSEDSFTSADFELTEYLCDGENTLAVQVYKYSSGSWLEDQDYWRFSGIFRDVFLYTTPSTHIFDIDLRTNLNDSFCCAEMSVTLKMQGELKGNIACALKDAQGEIVLDIQNTIQEQTVMSAAVEKPNLWSAEVPYLYTAEFIVYNEQGQPVEFVSQQVGFRRLEMIDKVYHINGKRIVFNGVNRHEFSHTKGRAITKEDMLWDICFLKQNNLNAVRTSHYPNNSLWYSLCDEYGIYVIDEANLESHGSWQKMGAVEPSWAIPDCNPDWRDATLDRGLSMLQRDKNHPSVVIWSCGNESYGGEIIYEMAEMFRKMDSTRAVHYEGVFHDRRYNDSSDFESRMYAKATEIETYLNNDPQKPFIHCEYSHAMGNSCGAMHKYTDLAHKYPLYQGGFLWDYIDQGILAKDCYGEEYIAFGGDFDDRPTDYNFCTNGIVFADRKPSPKIAEVKYLYQNFRITPDQTGATIENDSLFTNANHYTLVWSLEKDGCQQASGEMTVDVEPGIKKYVPIAYPVVEDGGIYTYNVSLQLKQDTKWAQKEHETAYGQTIITIPTPKTVQVNPITVIEGDVNIGIKGKDFHALFAKNLGALISYRYKGKEMVDAMTMPTFWRAPTDNDRGNGFHLQSAQWKLASLYRTCIEMQLSKTDHSATVTCVYQLHTNPEAQCKVVYTLFGDGEVKLQMSYKGTEGMPTMPLFGIEFIVPQRYSHIEWFANGPLENYSDRKHGTKLQRFQSEVCDEVTAYVVPQECGNRTGVRSAAVTDDEGRGLLFTSEEMELSVLPYTAHELENARHHFDLPKSRHTVVRAASAQCGVGGDDSWGAPIHPEYLIDSQKDQYLEFSFKGL